MRTFTKAVVTKSGLLGRKSNAVKILLCVLLCGSTSYQAAAQVFGNTYTMESVAGTYTYITGGTTLIAAGTDANSALTSFGGGFTFTYSGTAYTSFSVSSNGWMKFGSVIATSNTNARTNSLTTGANGAGADRPIIAPLWDALKIGSAAQGGLVSFIVTGTAPNRVCTIEWKKMLWDRNAANPVISFQVKLYETSNIIDFVYQQEGGALNNGNGGASIGISGTGTGNGNYLAVQTIPATAGAEVYELGFTESTGLATNLPSGQIFRWYPNTAIIDQTTAGTGSWTAPCGVTLVQVQAGGGGGGGGASTINGTGGAGGSGSLMAFSKVPVSAGSTYFYSVGAGGAAVAGVAGGTGGATWFNSTGANAVPSDGNSALGPGGLGGAASSTTGAAVPSGSIANYQGGAGTAGTGGSTGGGTQRGGAGGSGPWFFTIASVVAGGAGGNGSVGSVGNNPGAGGGGGSGAGRAGGAGGVGRLIVQYVTPVNAIAPTGASASVTSGCSGYSTTLTQTGGYIGTGGTWHWYSGSCGGTPIGTSTSTDASITVSVTANTTYYVRSEGACSGTSSCASVAVTSISYPIILGGVSSICQGASTTLSGSSPTGGTWSSSNANVNVDGLGRVTGLNAGTSIISYSGATSGGCYATQTETINPSVSAISFSSGATTGVCAGTGAVFTASATNPAAILSQNFNSWAPGATSGTDQVAPGGESWTIGLALGAGGPQSEFQAVTPPGNSFSFTGDGTNFLESNNLPYLAALAVAPSTDYVVTDLFSPHFSTAGLTSCTVSFNQFYSYPGTPTESAQCYYWSNALATWVSIHVQTGVNDNNLSWSAASPDQVYTLPADALGQASEQLLWYFVTTGSTWALDNIVVTGNASSTVLASGYVWTPISAGTSVANLSCTNCAAPTITPPGTLGGSYVYSVTATLGSCSSTAGVTITEYPATTITGGSSTICQGASTTLSGSPSGQTWVTGNSNTIVGGGTVTGVGVGTSLVSYGNPGCYATKLETVNASPSYVTVSPTAETVCSGGGRQITASATNITPLVSQDFNDGSLADKVNPAAAWLTHAYVPSEGWVNPGPKSPFQIVSPPGNYAAFTGDGTKFFETDNSDYYPVTPIGGTNGVATYLESPQFSTVGMKNVTLSYNEYFNSMPEAGVDEQLLVAYYDNFTNPAAPQWVALNGGTGTSDLNLSWSAGSPNRVYRLPDSAMGQPNMYILFQILTGGSTWALDNIVVQGGATASPLASTAFTWAGITNPAGVSCAPCAAPTLTPPSPVGAYIYSVTAAVGSCTTNAGVTLTETTLPTITTVSPVVGFPASAVSITGTGFDPTTTNNIVYFGATRASVSSVTGTTTISALVPIGATYMPVTIEEAGCTGYAKTSFLQSFNNTPYVSPTIINFDPLTVAATLDLPSGNSPAEMAIGDLDGDGKADVVVSNAGANTLSVFQNTGVSGTLAFTLINTITLDLTNTPARIALGDLDGDGKLDILVGFFNGNKVTVIRNTSTGTGVFTFGALADITTGNGPYGVAIADIDKDGKPDLVVANSTDNNVAVLRNISDIGSLTTSSFSAPFITGTATGTTPYFVSTGDIDGDGKIDIITTNNGSGNITILHNTSSPSNLSFTTSTSTAGTGPYNLAIADIDGDGKPEIIVNNNGSNNIGVFYNNSVSGTVTLGAQVPFTTGTGPNGIAIGDFDGDGRADIAIANRGSHTISVFKNLMTTTGVITAGSLAAKVDYATDGGANDAIGMGSSDLDGDGLPDLAVCEYTTGKISIFKNDPLKTITGITTVCVSSTTTLSEAAKGGTWSTTALASVATVGSTTGIVSGVGPGSATVFYNVPGGSISTVVTIDQPLLTSLSADPAAFCFSSVSAQTAQWTYSSAINGATNYSITWTSGGLSTATHASLSSPISVNIPANTANGIYTGSLIVYDVSPYLCSHTYPISVTVISSVPAPVTTTTSNTCNSITINWGAVTYATDYEVTIATASDFLSGVVAAGVLTGGATTYTQTGLTPGVQYYYKLRTKFVCGFSAVSAAGTSVNTTALPPAPVLSAPTCVNYNSITLNWLTAGVDAASYNVDVALDAGFTSHVSGYPQNVGLVLTKTVSSLTPGIQYYYRVQTMDACSAVSSYVSSNTTTVATPGAISSLVITPTSSITFSAAFTAPSPAPSGYLLVSSPGALTGSPTNGAAFTAGSTLAGTNGTIVGTSTTSPITNNAVAESANTSYTLTVVPYNNDGCGGPVYGNPVTGTVTTCPSTPVVSTGVTTASSIPININEATGALPAAFYLDVYADNAGATRAAGFPGQIAISPTGTSPNYSYTLNFLTANTTYYFKVTVVGACTVSNTAPFPSGMTQMNSCSQNYPGSSASSTAQIYPLSGTIASGVTSVQVSMQGGSGGATGNGGTGGLGGAVICTLAVSSGTTLQVFVGGTGGNGSGCALFCGAQAGGGGGVGGTRGSAGGNGAAALGSSYGGGGGGGSSEIRTSGGTLLITAAGGGGAGGNNRNGGNAGANGAGGIGGTGVAATSGGGFGANAGSFGGGGTGSSNAGNNGVPSGTGIGGNGGGTGGGGGGGGNGGGGGGGGGNSGNSGGGGGGANSVTGTGVTSGTGSENQSAGSAGAGFVTITILAVTTQTVTGTGPTSYCAGSVVAPTIGLSAAEVGVTYQLLANGASIASTTAASIAAFNFSGIPTPTVTTVYTAIAGSGCSFTNMSGSTTITVNALPVISTATTASSCSGVATGISLTASVPSTYTWSASSADGVTNFSNCGGSCTSAITDILNNPNATDGHVVYVVTPKSNTGSCTGSAVSITNTVYAQPRITTTPTAICSGTSNNIDLNGTVSIPSTFTWTNTPDAQISGATPCVSSCIPPIADLLFNSDAANAHNVVYNVTAVSTAHSCKSIIPLTQSVNPRPTVNAASPSAICSSLQTNIPLSASIAGSSFGWTIGTNPGSITGASNPGSGNTIQDFLTNPDAANPQTIQYVVTATAPAGSGGCVGTSSTNILQTVNPAPTVNSASPSAICSGGQTSITLGASITGSSFGWITTFNPGGITGASNPGSGNTIQDFLTNPDAVNVHTIKYVVTATAPVTGCVGTATTNIFQKVNPAPTVNAASPSAICSGGQTSIALSASIVGSSFGWTIGTNPGAITGASNPGSGGTIGDFLTNPDVVNPQTIQYVVTATAPAGSGGCVGTSSTNISQTVNPAPTVNSASPSAICSSLQTSIPLSASIAGSTFGWTIGTNAGAITGASNPGSGSTISDFLTNPDATNPQTIEYVVTATSPAGSGGCTGTSTTSIFQTVNPAPTVNSASPSAICSGAQTNIPLSASIAGSSFGWITTFNPGGITGASNPGSGSTIQDFLTNPDATNAHTIKYVVTATAPVTGCVGTITRSIFQKVNPTPTVNAASPSAICSSLQTSIPLSASVAGSTFGWTIGTNTGAITGASNPGSGGTIGDFLTNPDATNPQTIEYVVTATAPAGSGGCTGTSTTSIFQTVNPAPTVNSASPSAICSSLQTSIPLSASIAGSTFGWTIGTNVGAITGASNPGSGGTIGDFLTNPDAINPQTIEYIVTATAPVTGCFGTSTTSIFQTVNPAPTVNSASPSAICSSLQTSIPLSASIAGSTFGWTIGTNAGAIAGASNPGSGSTIGDFLTNPDATNPQTIEYVVTATAPAGSGGCTGTSTTSIFQAVNPAPTVNSASPSAICSSLQTSIPLSASVAGSSFNWITGSNPGSITGASNPGSGNTIGDFLNNPSNLIDNTIEYVVTATSPAGAGGCAGTSTTNIFQLVHPTPSIDASAPAAICNGMSTSIDLTARTSLSSTFSWSGYSPDIVTGYTAGPSNATPIADVLSNSDLVLQGTVLYTVTATDVTNLCQSVATVITQTVNATPSLLTGIPVLCVAGTQITLSDMALGGIWTSSNGSASVGPATGAVTQNSAGTPTITYAVGSDINLCQVTAVLTINATPTPIAGNLNLCVSGAATFLSDGSVGGTWTSGTPATAIIDVNSGQITPVSGVLSTTLITYANGLGAGCATMATATVNPLPNTPTASGTGTYCGSTTVTATLIGSGTIYFEGTNNSGTSVLQPYNPALPPVVSYTGPYGLAENNTYYFRARSAAGCWGGSGSVGVTLDPLPTAYNVTGGGTYCSGFSSTLHVGLQSSQPLSANITYELWFNGAATGTTLTGTGGPLDFGIQSAAGSYAVVATSPTPCTTSMSGTVTVVVAPVPNIYTVTGGGGYCAGSAGVPVGLSGSDPGVDYQLYLDGIAFDGLVAGHSDGSAIDFGTDLGVSGFTTGLYTVVASPGAPCHQTMTGSANVVVNPAPAIYTFSGGGTRCASDAGFDLALSSSQLGVDYQLFNSITGPVGSPKPGTGFELVYAGQTAAGVYSVEGINTTSSCPNTMSGTGTIIVHALPTALLMSAGNSYCAGGTGVDVSVVVTGVQVTDPLVSYQLLRNGFPVSGAAQNGNGTGGLDFGLQTLAGTYTVYATNTSTGCSNTMSGSTVVSVNTLPTVYNVTGGGSYCNGGSGVAVGLNFTGSGINYQLYDQFGPVGFLQSGTGAAISFGLETAVLGTTYSYSVVATDATTSCHSNMNGSAGVSVNPLPVNTFVVGGGGNYCVGGAGVDVSLGGSAPAVSYQLLYNGAASGSPLVGGSPLDFGLQTGLGTYKVQATDQSTLCTSTMTTSVNVGTNPLPALFTVTGGGTRCATDPGVAIGLNNSATAAVNYKLYNGATLMSTVAGTSGVLGFPVQTAAGVYTVVADDGTCTRTMSGSATIVVNAPPTAYNVTGGGSLCTGGTGAVVSLSGSDLGISYQLKLNGTSTGTPVSGTGFGISFGAQTGNGAYTAGAINTATGCSAMMSNTATVTVNTPPTAYAVTGGGGYCPGGSGRHVGLFASQAGTLGVTYQLYLNGSPVSGAVINNLSGTAALDFGLQTGVGTYTIGASDNATGCTDVMSGSVSIFINTPPTAYTVTGGGNYCPPPQGSGVDVSLGGSTLNVSYQLYAAGVAVPGAPTIGTGFAIDFGQQATVGNYTVKGTDPSTGCIATMSSSVNVGLNSLPVAYTLSGTNSYCLGGSGVDITLGGTELHTNYQLFRGGSPVGSPVAGSGFAYDFGNQTSPSGTVVYTAAAINTITGCTNGMLGTPSVTVNPLPVAYTVTGGGSYCFGGTGLHVGLSTTDAGISYQLLRNNIPVGAAVTPGATINYDFGAQLLAGTYTVGATNSVTGCINTMLGSAVISINPLPTAYLVTGGGGYCVGGTGVHVGLSGSVTGTTYQLYNGTGNVGGAIAGTGSSIDFGPELASVTNYSVTATATATGCSNTMSGSANVFTNPLPTVYALGGGGSYCSGGTGVHVMLGGSQTGVNYQLYNGSTLEGGLAGGTGSGLDFGLQTALGTYSVSAVNAVTGCVSAMTSTVTVSTTPLPTVYNVTGTGSYCFSGSGIVPGLSHSDIGISYQLYLNSTAEGAAVPGTGSAISFTSQTIAGTYTVLATNITTACTNGMNGGAAISINPLPAAYSVTGGGHYCQGGTGVHVGLSASATGISYQLYNGSVATGTAVIGTGSGIDFGLQTAGGTYSVTATNATTGCSAGMNSFATVTVDPLPTVYTISGGGGYCAGGSGLDITLGGSQIGISYQLYLNGIANGTAAAGTGTVLDYGLRTVAGTYTIIANNTGTGCTLSMGSSAVVVVNPLPAVYAMSGGGSYCAGGSGVHIGLANSNTGINYQLYSGIVPEGTAVAGTGAAIDFGLTGAAGTYTVLATDASTGCTKEMSGAESVGINGLPVVYNVTGGGSYCAGGAGVHIGLSGSEFGLSYQLYKAGAPWGVAVSGTGGTLDFGLQTVSGSYSVITTNPATSCTNTMSGSASVSINPLPAVYSVSGGGGYCAGGNGIAVGLNNSHTGINYQLYANGAAAGGAVAGTGSAISFGLQTAGGTYSVTATDATSGCSNAMGGSATVTVNPLPTVYNVTGGGSYCLGGAGMHVGLSGSATGISYQLYNNSGAVGGLTAGTGSALDFGLQATAGTYSVTAANVPTGCVNNMSGNVTVSVNNPPLAHNVTGSGSYCAGSAGPDLQLDGSEGGVNYSLYNGSSLVSTVAGGGGIVDFGPQAAAGTYSVSAVNATTGCSANMNGSATVALNPLPVAHNVTGGGSYCLGGSGVHVGLDGSATGINYKLYNGGTLESTKAGTGSAIDFGLQAAAGTYTVTAADGITNCARQMSGSVVVTINALPTAHNVTNTGSAYCAGGAGITIGLDASDAGIRYQLYDGSAAVGGAVSGGGTINFGPQLGAGTYSVSATNTISGCSAGMSGSATFSVTPLAAVYPVTGGGSYCQGAGGVDVAMGMSDGSVVYELFNGTTPVVALNGTGGVLDFLQQQAGSYTVVAFIGVCSDTMAGTAVVTENPLPTLYNVTGGGGYCLGGAGVSLGVDNSDVGTSYQLYLGSSPSGAAVSGTGHGISFGLRTGTGFYGVIATNNATGCTNTMNNTPLVSTNTPPVVFNVTGGGGYCAGTAGVAVGLDGSENGTTYNLYRGSVMVATATGGGIAFSFPLQAAGTYSVQATNGCSSNMAGSATATQNTLPGNYAVTGGGHYCASGTGIAVGLGGSAIGISYQLSNSAGTIGSAINGTGSAISFGVQTAQDVYSVTAANNTTGCSSVMGNSVSIVIDALPVAQPVNGGGSYCLGGAGVDISTGGSQAGIRYQLYLGSVSTATVTATGTAGVDFGNQAAAGTYVVTATDPASHCVNNMTGSVVVGINPLPTAYNLGGSASNYCAGGNGVDITLNNSQSTVSYQLYNGAGPVGAAIPGSGSSLDFGMQLAQGTYHVVGTDNTTGCSNMMSGTPVIVIDPLPAAYAVTGGGSYCAGSAGVHIGLAGSQAGIRYDLYAGSVIEASRTGTGGTLDFGAQTVAGTYIVMAANTTTLCTSQMAGTAVVTANALPTSYAVAGGGSYCAGGSGADIALAGSQSGVTYQLYNGSLPTGGAVSGTGSPIDFGVHTGAGNYTVTGTNTATGCTNNMSGSAVINVLSAPVVFTVTGGGSYCNGGGGVHIGLSGSATGVSYRLYNGATPSGGAVSGTGSGLDFGLQTAAGSYTVVATNVSSGGCSINMNGSAVVTINALPAVYHVTGGGSYCSGTGGVHVGLNNSATGISYQLYMNGSTVGAAVNGTGHALDFGAQLAPGAYSVYAQDNTTTCTDNMLDTVTISVTPTVVPSVTILSTPGDTVCAGTNVSFALLGANAGTAPVYNWTVNGLSVSVLNNYNYVPDSGDVVTLTMTSSAACATPATVTSSVTMTVNTNVVPVVTVSADLGDTVCSGTRVNYTATGVYGGTPSYTWMVNGATVGTGTTYGYAPQLGDVIVCMMNSTYPCRTANTVFSTPITMAIDTPVTPIVVITASPGTRIAQGQADTLTAVVPPSISGLITVSYQWLINGNPVPGATNPVFVNSNYVNGDSVTVQVTATTPCGSAATFNSVIIHVGTTGVTVVSGSAGNITLMPNPNKGDFSVRGTLGSAEDQEVSLEITDVLGQVIYKSKVMARGGVVDELIHLDKTVANGMYMLTLKSATDNKVFHVVIEQ